MKYIAGLLKYSYRDTAQFVATRTHAHTHISLRDVQIVTERVKLKTKSTKHKEKNY